MKAESLKKEETMRIKELLNDIEIVDKNISLDEEVSYLTNNSKDIVAGCAFVCLEGTKFDGHEYIEEAVKQGAKVVITQKDIAIKPGIQFVQVAGGRRAIAQMACNFYQNPSKEFRLIGITGTKGKTTTSYMVKSILEAKGEKVGLIGTIECKIGDKQLKTSENTTPAAIELQRMFRQMAEEKVDFVVMEVSSHALDLERVYGSHFAIAAFSNLSQDHMDYHKNFENYYQAKKKLFEICDFAVINTDDEYGSRLFDEVSCKKTSFGIEKTADFMAEEIAISASCVDFKTALGTVNVKIPGKFSVYNALLAMSVAKEAGCSLDEIQSGFNSLTVPGRSELVKIDSDFTVMVDYAHSPDSLNNILMTVREYAKGRVICVFGCGGDRDKTKRPIMGNIAAKLSDISIVTSDNPRSENPEEIILQIEEGMKNEKKEYLKEPDRAKAIYKALEIAQKDDVVVIAGKGHEPYQILNTGTIHFDDREQVKLQYEKLQQKNSL